MGRPFAFADRAGHIGPHASAEHVAESRLVIPVEATEVCHERVMACSSFVLNHSRFCGASLRTLPIVPEHKAGPFQQVYLRFRVHCCSEMLARGQGFGRWSGGEGLCL